MSFVSHPNGTGNARAWRGQVALTDGSTTINYEDDLPGVRGSLREEPTILVTGRGSSDAYVDSAGTSTATITDGTGDSTDTVNVIIYENREDITE